MDQPARGAVGDEGSPKPGGRREVWSMELTSPGNLTRVGWSRHSFKPGIASSWSSIRCATASTAVRSERRRCLSTGQVLTSNLRDAEKPGLQ